MRKKRVKGAYLEYHSRTNKHQDIGREARSRPGIKPSMSTRGEREYSAGRAAGEKRRIRASHATRGEREYSAGRPGGEKRRYKRDSKGRFA